MPPGRLALLCTIAALVGCARTAVPEPELAARRFAAAAARGDAATLHAMLTREAREHLGEAGVAKLVAESRAELGRMGRAFSAKPLHTTTITRVRFDDGEVAELALEDGQFRISSAAGLPSEARTPVDALDDLRNALARRSYAGLLRVLSKETQLAIERDLRSLVEGLENPESLQIRVTGDRAEVEVPGGHVVRLRREAGFWKVESFD